MITIIVILMVCWVTIRIIRLVGELWRLVNAESSPRLEHAAAA
jgi:hypothetical protein